jgi:hypothetical protein
MIPQRRDILYRSSTRILVYCDAVDEYLFPNLGVLVFDYSDIDVGIRIVTLEVLLE